MRWRWWPRCSYDSRRKPTETDIARVYTIHMYSTRLFSEKVDTSIYMTTLIYKYTKIIYFSCRLVQPILSRPWKLVVHVRKIWLHWFPFLMMSNRQIRPLPWTMKFFLIYPSHQSVILTAWPSVKTVTNCTSILWIQKATCWNTYRICMESLFFKND